MHLQTYETYGSIKPVMHKENTAVKVVNATYSYGDGPSQISALRGINLSVPTGGIYGLLGPSGCGKTTLLKCMVGRMRLRTGRVYIFGHRPGTPKSMVPGPAIGYMPQELALYYDFTIEETLTYFARVYRMKSCVIAQRIDFLLRFLDLPERTRFIGNLSGGQKRRVSLAVTLVHSPPLLILDEPTVGVDPVLRQAIWGHLVELTQTQNLTVIITTHYIEEARQASVCALMRYGRILIEASPAELLQRYNFSTLEDVFLKLCELDADNKLNHEILQRTEANNGITHADVCTYIRYEENGKNEIAIDAGIVEQSDDNKLNSKDIEERKNMENRILSDNCKSYFQKSSPLINTVAKCSALVRKNITRLRRNLPVLLFQFLLPSIEVILFCLCIGSDPFDLPVAIHNRELIVPEKFSMYSEKFIQAIDNHVVTKHYFNTADAAIESVHQGDAWAAMLIGENFTEALQTRFLQGNEAGKLTLENSKVHVYLDMTNQLIGYKLRRTFMESFQKFTKSQLEMMGLDPSHAELPVQFEIPIYGDREPTYTEFMAPGVILSISFLAAVALTALAFVLERKEGLLERSLVSGVTSYEFLMSHVLTQMFVLSVQIILLLIFTFLVFEIPCRGGFAWVIVLTYLQGVCGMGYGLLISSICVDENSAIMLALGSFYPNLLISGTVWPTQAMPTVMRYISYIFPQTIPIESLRYILSRGWGPSHPEVALGFAVTIGWTLFFLVAAVVVFRYKN